MTESGLHLVRVPLRADKLVASARRRQIRLRDVDDGYLVHCILAELWQDHAPSPFVLRGKGRTIDAWGYSTFDGPTLIGHAQAFGDPANLEVIDRVDAIVSKEMPLLERGRHVGFLSRVCPVTRLSKARNGHRAGAEVDVYLARSIAGNAKPDSIREAVYRDWFIERMKEIAVTGASVLRVSVAGMSRTRLVRRTQGKDRKARSLERPDVRLEGDLVIEDGEAFLHFLAHGVGRHRAFGFGALLVVPPGTSHGGH